VENFVGGGGGKSPGRSGKGGARGGFLVLLTDQILLLRMREHAGSTKGGEEGTEGYEGESLEFGELEGVVGSREKNGMEIVGRRGGEGEIKKPGEREFGPILERKAGEEEGKVVVVFERKDVEGEVRKGILEEMSKRERRRVFGVGLKQLLKNDRALLAESDEKTTNDNLIVPIVVKDLIKFLDNEGREVQGLFRVAGSRKTLEILRERIDNGGRVEEEIKKWRGGGENLSHTVAQLLKLFFRLLPEPLLTFEVYDDLIKAEEEFSGNTEALHAKMYALISPIPYENRCLGRYLVRFLARVGENGELNKMYPPNLAICFAPNLLRPRQHSISAALDVMKVNRVIEELIVNPEILSTEKKPGCWMAVGE